MKEKQNGASIKKLLKENNLGIRLDIGCGHNKQPGFVGMDVRSGPGIDVVQNLELFPWPFPDNSVSVAVASHVLEHIKPTLPDAKLVALIDLLLAKKVISQEDIKNYVGEYDHFGTFMRFMDEVWRILKPGAEFIFIVPYAGSQGYWQDPTHINPINEITMAYFDPMDRSNLYSIYRPKPWEIKNQSWNVHGFMEVILKKRLIDKSYGTKE